ncbi:MAG: GcvT family protein [Acidimicrobiia bacterium]|nr:GcvT family protein [Acidimicrobiia bacterium]
MGTALLYHITLEGWTDCLLLEKGELASGSTWHAAGQITHSTSSYGLASMTRYGTRKYAELEAETGQSVSWHNTGSLRLAYSPAENDWLRYTLSVGRGVGNRMELIGPDRIAEMHPFYNLDGVLGALYTPDDGHLDPASATAAFAAGARSRGATLKRNTLVTNTVQLDDGTWRVETDAGDFTAGVVVNAAGTYARQVGQWVGLDIPIVSMTHHYFVTEEIPELKTLEHELPVVRDDPHVSGYIRMERDAGLIGIYEKANPRSVWEDGTPWDADHHLFAPDYERVAPWLEAAFERMPLLADYGIQKAIHGAITHPPDGNMLLGPAPRLTNYWYCNGTQVGIAWGAGATMYLAKWMVNGHTILNMRAFDPRRYGSFATPEYNRTKAHEDYLLRHEIPYPGLNRTAGRPYKTSGVYRQMLDRGAVMEEIFGWERPRWFAPAGWPQVDIHAFDRPAWHAAVGREVETIRTAVGVADMSAFAKYDVTGSDATTFLDRLTTNRLPRVGRMGLTYMLTPHGMVEAEFTIARLADDEFYLVGAAVGEVRFEDWMRHRIGGFDVTIANRSDEVGVLAIAGPASRTLLAQLTDAPLDNASFSWLSAHEITVAGHRVRALRVSFSGELGWELHVPMPVVADVFDAVVEAGEPLDLGCFGTHALTSMRMEQAYKVSADMTNEVTAFEAGLMRFVDLDKEFIGRDALLVNMAAPRWLLVYLDIDTGDLAADCSGGEGVFVDGRRVGVVTTAGYGFGTGKSLAWAYVDPDVAAPNTELEVLVLGETCRAVVREEAVWDPKHERARS